MANSSVEPKTCAVCGDPFRVEDAGGLTCFAHPGEFDNNTSHYTCCGASLFSGACLKHAQASRAIPPGCHRIDHFETIDERNRVLKERPYTLAPLEQAMTSMPHAARPNGRTVIHITDERQLDQHDFALKLPRGWKGGQHVVKDNIYLDLRSEHDTLRNVIVQNTRDVKGDDYGEVSAYTSEWEQHMNESKEITTAAFVPFAIIMRISPVPDAERGVDRNAPCVY